MKLSELAKVELAREGTLQDFAYATFLDPDVRYIRRAGVNLDVDTATAPEDLFGGSGLYTGFPSAAEVVRLTSDSANDASAGSGARTVFVSGLDASGNFLSETVTLNGTTPVTTVGSYLRLNRAYVVTSGSSNTAFNVGTITIQQNVTTANVFAIIEPGVNEARTTAYTVATGQTGVLTRFEVSGLRAATSFSGLVAVYVKLPNQSPSLVEQAEVSSQLTTVRVIKGGLYLPAGTDVILRVLSTSSNNVAVSGFLEITVLRN